MSKRVRITEYLDIDVDSEMWCCHKCNAELISGLENYKRGCLVYARDPSTLYPPAGEARSTYAANPDWCRFVEFYCPGCGTMLEVEVLPPGHPITWDIQVDYKALTFNESTEIDHG